MKKCGRLLISLVCFSFSSVSFAAPLPGGLRVEVMDEKGAFLETPHIYIFHEETHQSQEYDAANGILALDLPPGHYRVYSAAVRRHDEFVDRYMSPTAHVRVIAQDESSVILRVDRTQPPVVYLSEYTRKKIGLDEDLARYVN